jgi:hypothetical protein
MRGHLVPTVVGCLLSCGVALPQAATPARAESVMKCVNGDTLSEIGGNLKEPQPAPLRLEPDPRYRRVDWAENEKHSTNFLSFKASTNGRAEIQIFDVPEPAVRRSVGRVLDCMSGR